MTIVSGYFAERAAWPGVHQTRAGPHRLETIANSFQDTYSDGIRLTFSPEMIRLLQTYTGVSWNAQLELLEYKVGS
jgi:hypothetical protein